MVLISSVLVYDIPCFLSITVLIEAVAIFHHEKPIILCPVKDLQPNFSLATLHTILSFKNGVTDMKRVWQEEGQQKSWNLRT